MKYATKKTVLELEDLFQTVNPKKLGNRINGLFFEFLIKTPVRELPEDFNELAEDTHFLIRFLKEAHKNRKDKTEMP